MAEQRGGVAIGKIVRSDSHVRYTCQIFGHGEVASPPLPDDYAFGSFVRIPLRQSPVSPDVALLTPLLLDGPTGVPDALVPAKNGHVPASGPHVVGLVYDTILVNPAFGTLGPRLSNDGQVELFSPDYLAERAVLVSVVLLGALSIEAGATSRIMHGVPELAPDLGAVAVSLSDAEVRAFHRFADDEAPGGARPYLHMGYLPHVVAQDHVLMPQAILRTVERLERLFPENAALLSIVKRNFAWRLKVEAAG